MLRPAKTSDWCLKKRSFVETTRATSNACAGLEDSCAPVHPISLDAIASYLSCSSSPSLGRDQDLKLLQGQAGEIEELRRAGLHVSEPDTGHGSCLLSRHGSIRDDSIFLIGINSNVLRGIRVGEQLHSMSYAHISTKMYF